MRISNIIFYVLNNKKLNNFLGKCFYVNTHNTRIAKMDLEQKQVLGECTFRAAAFWRLLYQVWFLTKKNCPEAFPIGNLAGLGGRDWENVQAHLKTLAYMIYEMNAGASARAEFLTSDETVLADATAMLVRAFSAMPELYNKLHMLFVLYSASSALGDADDDEPFIRRYTVNRTEEMMRLADEFNKLSKSIADKQVKHSAKLVLDEPSQNVYLTLSFHET